MNDIAGHCKSLVKLNVLYTRVTYHGIRLAIQHLPNLKTFECFGSVQVVSEIFREGLAVQTAARSDTSQRTDSCTRRLSLMNLNCRNHPSSPYYVGGMLANAVQLCPFVVRVNIYWCRDENFKLDLQALANLENLHHLALWHMSVSFDVGLLPILEKCGHNSLETLALGYLDEVDVAAIIKHCSNLQSLTLDEIGRITSSSHHQQKPPNSNVYQLRHLESLDICRVEDLSRDPTTATLCLLLRSCPALIKLYLAGLNGLTDQVFQEAAVEHGFNQLEDLDLSDCPNFTRSSVDMFLFTLNCPFNCISLDYCWQFHTEDAEEFVSAWKTKARENNWNFSLQVPSDDEEDSDED